MKRLSSILGAAVSIAGILVLAGCATDGIVYVPSQLGPIEKQAVGGDIELEIRPDESFVIIGRPLEFIAEIRNISNRDIWLPKTPRVVFLWTYPNGRRDNFVFDPIAPKRFTKRDAILLKPGQSMVSSQMINTYYFPEPGITEFRAYLHVPENTNPDLQPFWSGRAPSNGYGLMVHPKSFQQRQEFDIRDPISRTTLAPDRF
jgi:hypothetical protein